MDEPLKTHIFQYKSGNYYLFAQEIISLYGEMPISAFNSGFLRNMLHFSLGQILSSWNSSKFQWDFHMYLKAESVHLPCPISPRRFGLQQVPVKGGKNTPNIDAWYVGLNNNSNICYRSFYWYGKCFKLYVIKIF